MTLVTESVDALTEDPLFADVKRQIVELTGLAYYLDKDVQLASHIGRRLSALQMSECGPYLMRLLDPCVRAEELDALTAVLTNGETFFFRHQELFDALRQCVIPAIIDRNRSQRRIQIWSAGCANGAEPYSLSILLQHEFSSQLAGWDVRIVGTDINRDALRQAQLGEFTEWALRSMTEELQATCFHKSANNWTIRDVYRQGIHFYHHNLVGQPFSLLNGEAAAFDLILCRNVMIYFAPPVIHRLVGQFHNQLAERGWLVVGPAEPNTGLFRAFETVNALGAVLYRRRRSASAADSPIEPLIDMPVDLPAVAAAAATGGRLPTRSASAAAVGQSVVPDLIFKRSRVLQQAVEPSAGDRRRKLDRSRSAVAASSRRTQLPANRLDPLAHFCEALAAEHLGQHGESERALRRTIYLDSSFTLAHYLLGVALVRKSDRGGAGRSFRNVLVLLDDRGEGEVIPDADGLTVGALRQLTEMQLEVLKCT